ncbi:MAG: molecular chaperone DnaJ [Candidatus Komeilibacteria bacterium]
MAKDYYKILGVDKTASKEEIKKAFRKLAHEHHPDKGNGNDAKFKEINEAYQVLSNDDKRRQYDQFGSGGPFGFDGGRAGAGQAGGMNWQDFARQQQAGGGGFDFGDLGDIFGSWGDIFGFGAGSRGHAGPQHGHDIEARLRVSFAEAYHGVEKVLPLKRRVKCEHCHGNGAEPGSKISTCSTCQGKGRVQRVQQSIFGQIASTVICPDCQGAGERAEKPCSKCQGIGVQDKQETIKVKVPAGIDNGQTIKLTGQGEAGSKGAPSGDLYMTIVVEPDKVWRRDGDDLYTIKNISLTQATLGDKVVIVTMDGKVNLKIPAGTVAGKRFMIKGKGMPKLHGRGQGNLYVEIKINIPDKLSREQKKLLEKLRETGL